MDGTQLIKRIKYAQEEGRRSKTHAIIDGRKFKVGYPQCAGCENLVITHGICLYTGDGCEYPEEAVKHPLAFEAAEAIEDGSNFIADYSNFPFEDPTVAQVFALARESKDIGDEEFVNACMEAIRLDKCAAE